MPVEVSSEGTAIANEYYRVEYSLADAWISSLRELGPGRELVNPGALLGLNAYIFDRYATSTKVDHLSGRVFTRRPGPHSRPGNRRGCSGPAAGNERARGEPDR